MTLKIYHDGNDTVIAESPEDAANVFNEWLGSTYEPDEDDEWYQVHPDGNELYTITHDCLPDELTDDIMPEGAIIKQAKRGTNVTATVDAWIAKNGRGFLCSFDF